VKKVRKREEEEKKKKRVKEEEVRARERAFACDVIIACAPVIDVRGGVDGEDDVDEHRDYLRAKAEKEKESPEVPIDLT